MIPIYEIEDDFVLQDPLELLTYICSLPDEGYEMDSVEILECKKIAQRLKKEVFGEP